jgi:hypothetical protein
MTMPDKTAAIPGTVPAMPDKFHDLLRQAAQAMPARFRDAPFPWVDYTYPHSWQVFMRGDWEAIWIQEDEVEWSPLWDLFLEAACREECGARGWVHSLQGNGPDRDWTVVVRSGKFEYLSHACAPTPAHALLAALLSAVEAQA